MNMNVVMTHVQNLSLKMRTNVNIYILIKQYFLSRIFLVYSFGGIFADT